jgi:hypothetical protein
MMATNMFWEYGGDFPWPEPLEIRALMPPLGRGSHFRKGVFFGTGRAAMLGLLEHGKAKRGWRRLWAPSYFCPRVMDTLEQAGWDCPRYEDTPLSQPAGLPARVEPGDVVLRMNFFGWRGAEAISGAAHLNCDVIEDHSHDPSGRPFRSQTGAGSGHLPLRTFQARERPPICTCVPRALKYPG